MGNRKEQKMGGRMSLFYESEMKDMQLPTQPIQLLRHWSTTTTFPHEGFTLQNRVVADSFFYYGQLLFTIVKLT